jgi:uncharacterized membrane protein YdcZ (DUF606 family)
MPLLATVVSFDWRTLVLIMGAVQLALAAAKVADLPRWNWLAGGALFVTLSLFFSVS